MASLFLTLALDEGEWSVSLHCRFTPRKNVTDTRLIEAGWAPKPIWTLWSRKNSLVSTRNRTPGRPAVAHLCTDIHPGICDNIFFAWAGTNCLLFESNLWMNCLSNLWYKILNTVAVMSYIFCNITSLRTFNWPTWCYIPEDRTLPQYREYYPPKWQVSLPFICTILDFCVMIREWTKDVVKHFPASFIDAVKPIIVQLTDNSSSKPQQLIPDFLFQLSHRLFVLQPELLWNYNSFS
jgi:hypothetical protein